MAALAVTNPTLLDLARQTDPNGSIADIAEILNEVNDVLDDMTWQEGNLPTGHRSSIRSGIPAPTWRKLYGGVVPNKGTVVQVTDNCGMLEAYAEVDVRLVKLASDPKAFRLNEDRAHIEGISQEVADTLFYGNEGTEPEAFTGLSPRYNALTTTESPVAENVITGGGSGTDNGSIWLIVWSPRTLFGIVPKGSTAGIQARDLGEVTVEDASNGSNTGRYQAYRTHYTMDAGVVVKDWRYAVRICNIDKSVLVKDAATGADLPDLMFQAMRKVPSLAAGRPAFYMSRDMATMLGRQTANLTKNSTLTAEMVGGKLVERFHGIPVRRVDALSADEALVV